jgi:ketosteroid isomerase-like protein
MSRQNVELVKRVQPTGVDFVELFADGGEGLGLSEEDEERFHDDFEVRFISEYTSGPSELDAAGAEGLAGGWQQWLTPFKSYWLELEQVIDAGRDVVTFVRVEAQTERDGVVMKHAPAAIWRFDDEGKVVALHFYLDRAEALEAAGLPSEATAHESE